MGVDFNARKGQTVWCFSVELFKIRKITLENRENATHLKTSHTENQTGDVFASDSRRLPNQILVGGSICSNHRASLKSVS